MSIRSPQSLDFDLGDAERLVHRLVLFSLPHFLGFHPCPHFPAGLPLILRPKSIHDFAGVGGFVGFLCFRSGCPGGKRCVAEPLYGDALDGLIDLRGTGQRDQAAGEIGFAAWRGLDPSAPDEHELRIVACRMGFSPCPEIYFTANGISNDGIQEDQ